MLIWLITERTGTNELKYGAISPMSEERTIWGLFNIAFTSPRAEHWWLCTEAIRYIKCILKSSVLGRINQTRENSILVLIRYINIFTQLL